MTGRVVAFVAAAVAAVVLAASASANQAPAALSGFVCHTASNSLSRYIEVTATMRPMPSTGRMKLRFELLQRVPGRPFRQVFGGDLGRWRQLSVGPWAVKKPVANLAAPAVYRFRVSFLWLGRSGGVIGMQTLLGPRCRQPK